MNVQQKLDYHCSEKYKQKKKKDKDKLKVALHMVLD